eukprot:TRINITY_DN54332_c0_g1_i1.p1 TRINITY_DN54332_c0_g1~~TRINITY_DN54332_c0_g1_i1.p1  ORF type:complete len:139 (-),score=24.13 TRINITY_DN54332_c0_g1_i1:112-528(-)
MSSSQLLVVLLLLFRSLGARTFRPTGLEAIDEPLAAGASIVGTSQTDCRAALDLQKLNEGLQQLDLAKQELKGLSGSEWPLLWAGSQRQEKVVASSISRYLDVEVQRVLSLIAAGEARQKELEQRIKRECNGVHPSDT